MNTELTRMVELTDSELDAVTGGLVTVVVANALNNNEILSRNNVDVAIDVTDNNIAVLGVIQDNT